jgi:hypothetical protein
MPNGPGGQPTGPRVLPPATVKDHLRHLLTEIGAREPAQEVGYP